MEAARKCAVCGSTGKVLKCGRCKSIYYCSREHQASHWSSHKITCSPPSSKPVQSIKSNQGELAKPTHVGSIEPVLDIHVFSNVTPDNLQVTEGVVGRREENATSLFYKRVKNANIHNNGELPPASNTFMRSKDATVFVVYSIEVKDKVQGWKYWKQSYSKVPWIGHKGDIIILIQPGKYYHVDFELHTVTGTVEIIGEGEHSGEVEITNSEDPFEDGGYCFHGKKAIRVCNCKLDCTIGEGTITGALVELDSVICESPYSCDTYFQDIIYSEKTEDVILKDCKFSYSGTILHNDNIGSVYVIHCTFEKCGMKRSWMENDPFTYAPLFRIGKLMSIMICNSKVDNSNKGHILHRSRSGLEILESLTDFQRRTLSCLPDFNNNEIISKIKTETQKEAAMPIGKTILKDNEFTLTTCENCDVIINPTMTDGIHCLPDEATTLMKRDERRNQLKLKFQQLVDEQSGYLKDLPSDAPEIMKKCIERWNLTAPYNMNADWEGYWKLRDSFENETVCLSDEYEDDMNSAIAKISSSFKSNIEKAITSNQSMSGINMETFKQSCYLRKVEIARDSKYKDSQSLTGFIFSTHASGLYFQFISYVLNYKRRYQMDFFIEDNEGRHILELCGMDDDTTHQLYETRLTQEGDLLTLMQLITGRNDIDCYFFFTLMFHAAGGKINKFMDQWPVEYAEKKFKDRLPHEEFIKVCPLERDTRKPRGEMPNFGGEGAPDCAMQ